MAREDRSSFSNVLLRSLGADEFQSVLARLERVWIEQDQMVIRAGQPIEYVYFPETGFVSTTASTAADGRTEVGITGREGMIGVPLVLGTDRTPHESFVQAGRVMASRIGATEFRELLAEVEPLRALLLRYTQALLIQSAHSIVSNARHRIETRLSRWLLMCHDRSESDEINLTHDFMSMMIAAQRTGVTLCLHMLEGAGMIRSRRARVTILDRPRLEALAGDAYGVAEAEYRRLIGPWAGNGAARPPIDEERSELAAKRIAS
jgi:CRP-like cAMP-binding protein